MITTDFECSEGDWVEQAFLLIHWVLQVPQIKHVQKRVHCHSLPWELNISNPKWLLTYQFQSAIIPYTFCFILSIQSLLQDNPLLIFSLSNITLFLHHFSGMSASFLIQHFFNIVLTSFFFFFFFSLNIVLSFIWTIFLKPRSDNPDLIIALIFFDVKV